MHCISEISPLAAIDAVRGAFHTLISMMMIRGYCHALLRDRVLNGEIKKDLIACHLAMNRERKRKTYR
jgi:uncharacterized membrane protein